MFDTKEYGLIVDTSHWQGDYPIAGIIEMADDAVILKATDGWYMPLKERNPDGTFKYVYDEEHHIDAYFIDKATQYYREGVLFGGYHFVRFTNTYYNLEWSQDELIEANLNYYIDAWDRLPTEIRYSRTAIFDCEQKSEELKAAGHTKESISYFIVRLVDLAFEVFENVILYGGSYWFNAWLTEAARTYLASKCSMWEAEYRYAYPLEQNSDGQTTGFRGEYTPTVAEGWNPIFAESIKTLKGNMFGQQFTSDARRWPYMGDIDLSRTKLPYTALEYLFAPIAPDIPTEEEMEETLEMITKKLVEEFITQMRTIEEAFTSASTQLTNAVYTFQGKVTDIEVELAKIKELIDEEVDPSEEEETPETPETEEPEEEYIVPSKIAALSWKTNETLLEWSTNWNDTFDTNKIKSWDEIPSDEKAMWQLNLPEDKETIILRTPARNLANNRILRNRKGGIMFDTRVAPTSQAAPKVSNSSWTVGAWGFSQPLTGGTQANGEPYVVLVGDSTVWGHEFYAVEAKYVKRID